MKNLIEELIELKPITVVKPKEFFIAWQGVPTLAYEGFTETLLSIKQGLTTKVPGLRNENPGSLWPKTTLGALNDKKNLNWQDAYKLKQICKNFQADINKNKPFKISNLSIVLFQCRSLEKRLLTHNMELSSKATPKDLIPDYHKELVKQTMKQFANENLLEYLKDLQKEGNRLSDYTNDFIESTLIFDLPFEKGETQFIDKFCNEIDNKLPGLYTWFSKESRHMTVRALV